MSEQPAQRALAAVTGTGIDFRATVHGPVSSLEQAAAARGLTPGQVLKSIVVRRSADDYLFVLVPGDRTFSWPKLRALLGVNRLSMPDADTAYAVTGYLRGTITPFGASHAWPVIADASIPGRRISMGAGAPGVSVSLEADQMIAALKATVADISD